MSESEEKASTNSDSEDKQKQDIAQDWIKVAIPDESGLPASKQRVCEHTCDADGFKGRDASAAKNQLLNELRYIH